MLCSDLILLIVAWFHEFSDLMADLIHFGSIFSCDFLVLMAIFWAEINFLLSGISFLACSMVGESSSGSSSFLSLSSVLLNIAMT